MHPQLCSSRIQASWLCFLAYSALPAGWKPVASSGASSGVSSASSREGKSTCAFSNGVIRILKRRSKSSRWLEHQNSAPKPHWLQDIRTPAPSAALPVIPVTKSLDLPHAFRFCNATFARSMYRILSCEFNNEGGAKRGPAVTS